MPSHLLGGSRVRPCISTLMLPILATMASIYVAGRLWQDAENRVYLMEELDKRTDGLAAILSANLDKPRVYIGCMKSGEGLQAAEPDWWKFGDDKLYFRHAYGEIFVISQALARFVSINRGCMFSRLTQFQDNLYVHNYAPRETIFLLSTNLPLLIWNILIAATVS